MCAKIDNNKLFGWHYNFNSNILGHSEKHDVPQYNSGCHLNKGSSTILNGHISLPSGHVRLDESELSGLVYRS